MEHQNITDVNAYMNATLWSSKFKNPFIHPFKPIHLETEILGFEQFIIFLK